MSNEPPITIDELMQSSGVKFGTSGARGLAEAMTDRVCYAYTAAFVQYLKTQGQAAEDSALALAGDLRPSTPRILAACARAAADQGLRPIFCGQIPTPALALFGIEEGIPSLMITGSHIPDDRNGIKFYKPAGEILKPDEQAIRTQRVQLPADRFDAAGRLTAPPVAPLHDDTAFVLYLARFGAYFSSNLLRGRRIALYGHSSVARETLAALLAELGAEVLPLGYSERFIPVDTEAIRPEDVELARQWARDPGFDAIVSTDGDGDRPLIGDAAGHWLRGDIVGVLCARELGARTLATPVSSNTVAERCGWFERVIRTRIGSPYVIAAMQEALAQGAEGVAGYEANGGFLTASVLAGRCDTLSPLPTRDAVLPILAVLSAAFGRDRTIAELVAELPARYTYSDRLKGFPAEISGPRIAELEADPAAVDRLFEARFGPVAALDATDGLRITFKSGEIAHIRPSGNAPELRCYNEAETPERAQQMNAICLQTLGLWRTRGEL